VNTTGTTTDNNDSLVRLDSICLALGASDDSSDLGLEFLLIGSNDNLVSFDLG
jgi:hypothetical protein